MPDPEPLLFPDLRSEPAELAYSHSRPAVGRAHRGSPELQGRLLRNTQTGWVPVRFRIPRPDARRRKMQSRVYGGRHTWRSSAPKPAHFRG